MIIKLLIAGILLFFQHPVLADIITDGSVGNAGNIGRIQPINPTSNGQITIDQGLGSLEGTNLFHSFQQFDIEKNETATFAGVDMIQNVISRVTGGNLSLIDGILRSEVGSADFYFINPAGVVFGENAQVDVPASFHVSTAGELIFADGSSFSALNPEASTLTVASPEEFGFTSGQIGSMKIIGGTLRFKPGTDVSMSANSLFFKGIQHDSENTQQAKIAVNRANPSREQGIHLNLAAIDSSTTQKIPIINLANTSATGGELSIENSRINVSGNGSGRLAIRSGTMTVKNSDLLAYNLGTLPTRLENGIDVYVDSLLLQDSTLGTQANNQGNGGDITVTANKAIKILNSGRISSSTLGNGNAGRIDINAKQLTILTFFGGIESRSFGSSFGSSSGNTGDVTVTVDETIFIASDDSLTNTEARAGSISTVGAGAGNAGNVTVTAKQIDLDNFGTIRSTSNFGSSGENSDSNSGNVKVSAEQLTISNQGLINTNSSSLQGNSGTIEIIANELTIVGTDDSKRTTGITTNVTTIDNSENGKNGVAGKIKVTVTGTMQILNGGRIDSSTFSSGNAGIIEATAGQLTIDGLGSKISSDTFGAGRAGSVAVTAKELIKIQNEGRISSNTSGLGTAGDVIVDAGQLIIVGTNKENTGISTRAFGNSKSDAGSIKVNVDNTIQLLNHGQINTSSFDGEGGDIDIVSGEWNQLQNNSQIIASVISKQNKQKAGNITIVAPVLILDTAKILADATSEDTMEGNVDIETTLVASGDSFDTDPNIIPSPINIISAATSGELKITSPELNIVGTLTDVTALSLDIERFSQDPCAHGRKNSLKNLGHGGAPAFQHGENYLPINRFDETEPEPDDRDLLETTPSTHTDHENTATECAKFQRTSLNEL